MQPLQYSLELQTEIESELRRLNAQDYIVQDYLGYIAIGQTNPCWLPEDALTTLKTLPDGKMLCTGQHELYELLERPSFEKIHAIIEQALQLADNWSQIGAQPLYTWIEGKTQIPLKGVTGQYARWYIQTRYNEYQTL